ncbi:MAG: bile acid:sodium symporter family protein [Bacteroidetes bacterium]|nr:MAG: bile acid:sodium symporter family protein [Bacteroidota bacterium]
MNESVDHIQLSFTPESLLLLNIILGFIMYGVALELRVEDFKRILFEPKAPLVGVISQFVLLPALTFCLIYLIRPQPSIALGMILVAACPGGNISNFISLLAKGNAALSVTLTAVATLLAIVMTPFNFAFWGGLYPPTAALLTRISLDPVEMLTTILLLLGLPLVLGMATAYRFPVLTRRILKPIKVLSLLFFAGFVVVALSNNFDYFLKYIHYIIFIVLAHNAAAFLGGYGFARIMGLSGADVRSVTIETGIQNSGLALVLIFGFFGGLGGMAIIAAWWGIWHILAGLSLAAVWSRY